MTDQTSIERLAQTAVTMTQAAFGRGADKVAIDGLIRHLSSMLDFENERQRRDANVVLDCRAGCDHCCYEIALATVPEVLAIYYHVQDKFSDEEKAQLRERLDEYEKEMARLREQPFFFEKVGCPMLNGHLCSIYELRPLICRGRNSKDVNACELLRFAPGEAPMFPLFEPQWQAQTAVEKGINHALTGILQKGRFELGQCLKMLLDRPGLDAAILNKKAAFPSPVPAKRPKNFDLRPTDIPIEMPEDQNLAIGAILTELGRFDEVDKVLDESNVIHLFGKLRLPMMASSVEQIHESLDRFSQTLDKLEVMDFDPKVAVNALAFRQLVSFPLHGFSVKNLLERQGHLFVDRITSKLYPHLTAPMGKRKPGKFRVGYLSSNLNNSHGCNWALGWLQGHGEEFETYTFNLGQSDIMTRRFAAASDHHETITGATQPAAEWIRSLDLDAMIFTDVGSRKGDYQLASLRLARVQCTAWGMPVTSGLPTMDYYLSSELMEPEDADKEYTERLIRLPNSGLVLKKPHGVIHPRPRIESGVPEGFFPFMAQNLYKWSPQNDALLAKVYQRHGKPLIMVGYPQQESLDIFTARMQRHGVEVQLLPRTDVIGFNRYMQMADASYDAPTWSGGNTTLEALLLGIPTVTLPGEFMRGRHTYAFNKIAGVPGLIASDEDDYVDLIFDQERQREAMKELNVDALYEDHSVNEALNKFLLGTLS